MEQDGSQPGQEGAAEAEARSSVPAVGRAAPVAGNPPSQVP